MDAFQMAQIATASRIDALAKEIASQRLYVECCAMTNCAGIAPEEQLARYAEYELAHAKLYSMRQRLSDLIHERDTFGVCL
jgi:hypothetical protein